jgi:hypothetical protein
MNHDELQDESERPDDRWRVVADRVFEGLEPPPSEEFVRGVMARVEDAEIGVWERVWNAVFPGAWRWMLAGGAVALLAVSIGIGRRASSLPTAVDEPTTVEALAAVWSEGETNTEAMESAGSTPEDVETYFL